MSEHPPHARRTATVATLVGALLLAFVLGGLLMARLVVSQPETLIEPLMWILTGDFPGPPPSDAMVDLQTPVIKRFIDDNAQVLRHTSDDIRRISGERDAVGSMDETVIYAVYLKGHLQAWYFYFRNPERPLELAEVNAWPDGGADSVERDWTPDGGWQDEADTW